MISLVEAKPGQGKSTYATYMIMDMLIFKKNIKVATNIPLSLPESKKRRNLYHVNDWQDIKKLMYEHIENTTRDRKIEGTLVFVLDELSILLDANNWDNLPQEVKFLLRQHRKFGVDIIGFSQSVRDIDVKYRRLVQRLFTIRKLFVVPIPKYPYGLFWVREWDSDDVDKEKQERNPLPLIFNPPELVLADPAVFRATDSWALFELNKSPVRIHDHVTNICALHGADCPDLKHKISHA